MAELDVPGDRTEDRSFDRHLAASATERVPLRLTILTSRFSDTQISRAQALYLLARHLGHAVTVVTTEPGEVIESLRRDPFARGLQRVSQVELHQLVQDGTDVLCTVKALEESLGQGQKLCRSTGTPLLADIDDPDIETRTISSGSTGPRNAYRMGAALEVAPGAAAARRDRQAGGQHGVEPRAASPLGWGHRPARTGRPGLRLSSCRPWPAHRLRRDDEEPQGHGPPA